MKIIMGSQSKSRRKLLGRIVPEFESMSADIDEKAIRSDDYKLLPLLLARSKAEALIPKITEDSLLITSDQVSICNGELREKPESPEQAREYLRSYRNYPVETITAVVVTNTVTEKRFERVDTAKVFFRPIPEEVINQLIGEGNILSASGGFRVEDPLLNKYVDHVEGSEESVMGLPLEVTRELLDLAMQ